jgi:peptide-methionine (S)-S-oxide reductase
MNFFPDAEAIRVTFDPKKLAYYDLLKMYFGFHTPSDPRFAGTQYRSAIFVHDAEQREYAELFVLSNGLGRFVSVEDSSDFYKGEEYHQNYIDKAMMR